MNHFIARQILQTTFWFICLFGILTLPVFAFEEETEIKEPFYKNVSANIEMRLVIESDEEEIPWLYMQDLEGASHKVSEEILIDSSDVEGATTTVSEFGEKMLTLYFYPSSWEKVYEATTRAKSKKVAMLKEGQIHTTPIVYERIFHAAQIAGDPLASEEALLSGFVLGTRPSHLDSKELYNQFLADILSSHPEDLKLKQTLAYSYLKNKNPRQLEKALPLFQELAETKPNDGFIQTNLVLNLARLEKFTEALSTAESSLNRIPETDQIFMHKIVGEIYFWIGNKDKALESLRQQLKMVQELEFFKREQGRSEKELAKIYEQLGWSLPDKAKYIKKIKARIDYIQTH